MFGSWCTENLKNLPTISIHVFKTIRLINMSDLIVVKVEDDSSDERETVCIAENQSNVALEPNAEAKVDSVSADQLNVDEKANNEETADTADSTEDEDKPLLELMKHLINYNGKKNTKLTNNQLIGILKKEFCLDVANLHFFSVDIYMNVLKKFLKDWPQWDEFDQVMHETRCMNDKEEIERTLEREYLSLKEYLGAILKASQPFVRVATQKLKRSQDIPESSKAVPDGDVILEINCTRDQLNTLFFRRPHPEYKSMIFNINNDLPSKISLKPVTFESILNSCYVNLAINMTCFKYKRELTHNFKHTLVNQKLRQIQREPPLNPYLQCPKNTRVDSRLLIKHTINTVIEKIQRSNRYTSNIQPDIDTLFNVIKNDCQILMNDKLAIDLPCTYRHYLSSYSYIRRLYQEVDTRSEKYDLQLEEKISPMLKFHIGRLNVLSSAVTTELNWVRMECAICGIVYTGVTGIEALKAHFTDVHQNEPNWICMHCDKEFEAQELAAARWHHTCEDVPTDKPELIS